jgi:hypothetical protein
MHVQSYNVGVITHPILLADTVRKMRHLQGSRLSAFNVLAPITQINCTRTDRRGSEPHNIHVPKPYFVRGAYKNFKHETPLLDFADVMTLESQLLHKTLELVICCLAKGHQVRLWPKKNNILDRFCSGKIYVLHFGHIAPHPPSLMQRTKQHVFQIWDTTLALVKADLPVTAITQMC